MRASVIGLGAFGTALANILASRSDEVRAWAREPKVVDSINVGRENRAYLPGVAVSPRVRATLSLEEALARERAGGVRHAVPRDPRRGQARRCRTSREHVPLITVAKGIENETLLTMTRAARGLPARGVSTRTSRVLSGPSFAKEMATGHADGGHHRRHWEKVAQRIQTSLQTRDVPHLHLDRRRRACRWAAR